MRKDKEIAFQLRRSGKSYKQISFELGVPPSTLSNWFKNEPWSTEIRDSLASTESLAYPEKLKRVVSAIKNKHAKLNEFYKKEASVEFTELKKNPLFMAGIMLYWSEGGKSTKNSVLRFTNSDPDMVRLYCLFLKKILKLPKHKIATRLLLYPDSTDEPQKRFWSRIIDMPLENFRKSIYIKGKQPKNRKSYGVCSVEVYNRKLIEKMLKWIELSRQHLLNKL
ncbi:MAG: hypothetical protein COV29_04345 [Candidatus Yanofskybacteria bacterium CG10_big_fil_rev_8_21_14_0_10_36_16]|uniref:Uncharacterized protein n=1 Tax=Candidatus Yanofskybacteria bacterium CG10_big_fil_rev_8_21_14_0_10_36_16 TaxID=1975096 RepID=A0A2J0Q6E5_9BACT|nr:MAG: hypothetical protein COV29_04345 [Candidatus Yanofskybacteria bacterium CG10_big_fil_rev_8_21_14_0_10_36_16]